MTQKIILVGQAPGKRSKEPLDGTAGRRLAALASLDLPEFLKRFERINLLDATSSDIVAMRKRADEIREGWVGRRVVLLDKAVAIAFRLIDTDYEWFKPLEIPPGFEVAVIPNPAGMSSWWNDPANVMAARDFMLRLKVGFFETKTRDPREQFSVDQIAAALEAGRGVYTWAAEAIAEHTGRRCTAQTVKNYVDRYPEQLQPVMADMRRAFFGAAARNIIRSVEGGDVEDSWRAWQTRPARDAMAEIGVNFVREISARMNGQMQHDHRHAHAHLHARLNGAGLDLSRYSDEQLQAIEEFASVLGAEPEPE